ncbi:sensor histidine kinase [Candidatus Paracaedibacter symbiosus]|uniref:sensor histidine kinase n=1 Tax=Candidatus Paracaedibacter symbiosus TaxID=244582 RepID=UPI001E4FC0CC|nr:HAMP domain-containing sensor histidine kinase [Candidatus Paracaedibacter symbiosus]
MVDEFYVIFFFLFLFFDLVMALTIFTIGAVAGCLVFYYLLPPFYLDLGSIDLFEFFCTIFAAVIIGGLFSYKKENIQKIKQQSLKMQAAAIAHEMRTPLAAISHLADGLKINLPILIDTQQTAQDKDESVTYVHKSQLQYLEDTPTELEAVTKSAFIVIDMLLMNLRENPSEAVLEKHSILDCVKNALEAYALTKREKALISLGIAEDFEIKANSHLLKHVFFNLLKNSLHYIKAVRKGKIVIWTEKGEQVNKLYFKDTGKGISKESLPYVFNQFYSRTDHGTGVGLAFCKMVLQHLGGDITCDSIEGEFTQFTLIFPVLK